MRGPDIPAEKWKGLYSVLDKVAKLLGAMNRANRVATRYHPCGLPRVVIS